MTMVFGGDFRQVLPIIPNGSWQDIVSASFKQSYLWDHCNVLKLTANMRLIAGARPEDVTELREFAEWILKVGDGDIGEHYDGKVCIDLREEILLDAVDDPAILAPMNEVVDNMNEHLLEKFQGEEMVYLSSDNVDKTKRHATIYQSIFSPEFINGLKFSSVPKHMLALKVGVPIMLLKNIDQPKRLCNGTRLQLLKLIRTSISSQNSNETHFGKKVIIPRLRITPSDKQLQLKIVRKQFPLSVSFVLAIEKIQGQSLSKVGLYLPRPVFTHGQLYVVIMMEIYLKLL
nr:hypothetical protein [Tanacetum cinerariifolium]